MSNKTSVIAEPSQPSLLVERVFDAPREEVFEMFTNKDLLKKWWNPYGEADAEFDAHEGGKWRFSGDGNAKFHGVIHEITAPERLVQTEEHDGAPERGHVALDRLDFAELPGDKTKLTMVTMFLSVAERDAAVKKGMTTGIEKCYEIIDELLKGGL